MTAPAAAMRAMLLRALLLGVLAVGVVSMHTIGHASGHDGRTSLAMVASGAGEMPAADQPDRATDAGDPCDAHLCAAAVPVPATHDRSPGGNHRDAGLVIICLAVLAGLGVLALLAAGITRRRAGPLPAGRPARGGRNTDLALMPSFTLRLVGVAVLRT